MTTYPLGKPVVKQDSPGLLVRMRSCTVLLGGELTIYNKTVHVLVV